MALIYYHNPRCSKSRQGLDLLQQHAVTIRYYLKDPLSELELDTLLSKLVDPIPAIIRQSDVVRLGISVVDTSLPAIRSLLLAHPSLLQRPILETTDRAIIGRPPERLLEILTTM